MHFILKPLYKHAHLVMLLSFIAAVLIAGVLLRPRVKESQLNTLNLIHDFEFIEYDPMKNVTTIGPKKTRRKEFLYRLLTNTTRSLIQMEIKARRLEENMRRIKEKTADLLWNNKDKALWHILFKNISRHIAIRHEFHQHASLHRILEDGKSSRHRKGLKHFFFK